MFHPKGPTFFELARQALSSTERGYDLLAPKFDFTPFRTPAFVLDAVREHLSGSDYSSQRAVDFCCGTGAGMQMLLNLGFSHVQGIDFSQGMIEQARKNLKRDREQQTFDMDFGDVMQPRYDAEFDMAVSFGAFGHILPKQEKDFIQRVSESLKPGGRFVFVTTPMLPMWSPAYWMARGFNAAMHVRNLMIKPKFIMFYLTFLWPDIKKHFDAAGMTADSQLLFPNQKRFRYVLLITATKS